MKVIPLFMLLVLGTNRVLYAEEMVGEAEMPVPTISTNTSLESTEISWYDVAWRHVTDTYQQGNWEVIVPFSTYHMRNAYTPEQIAGYEESPPGFGLGKGQINSSGNYEGLYAMGYQDSHHYPSWQVGYVWQAIWPVINEEFRVGVGYTAFILAREDIAHYRPFPAAAPMASIAYKNLAVDLTFIPFSNVFFSNIKLAIK
ncbi:MAG: hypothetical protein K2P98_03220 [Neisseriaceae bacterium]|nr:hypothetical protein [Neisseriaceae bacterium]